MTCGYSPLRHAAERLPEASAGFGLLFTLTSGNVPPARARAAANACRQGAARRLAGRGRTARFPGCCRVAGRRWGHSAPNLHRCGYRPRRASCRDTSSRFPTSSTGQLWKLTDPRCRKVVGVFFLDFGWAIVVRVKASVIEHLIHREPLCSVDAASRSCGCT